MSNFVTFSILFGIAGILVYYFIIKKFPTLHQIIESFLYGTLFFQGMVALYAALFQQYPFGMTLEDMRIAWFAGGAVLVYYPAYFFYGRFRSVKSRHSKKYKRIQ